MVYTIKVKNLELANTDSNTRLTLQSNTWKQKKNSWISADKIKQILSSTTPTPCLHYQKD
jgi:hypothetical protein